MRAIPARPTVEQCHADDSVMWEGDGTALREQPTVQGMAGGQVTTVTRKASPMAPCLWFVAMWHLSQAGRAKAYHPRLSNIVLVDDENGIINTDANQRVRVASSKRLTLPFASERPIRFEGMVDGNARVRVLRTHVKPRG